MLWLGLRRKLGGCLHSKLGKIKEVRQTKNIAVDSTFVKYDGQTFEISKKAQNIYEMNPKHTNINFQ